MDNPSERRPEPSPSRLDHGAESADPLLPAFLARPEDAPVYHGFPLLESSRTGDGWCFGTISDPDSEEGCEWGDAFVVAPDGSRAGIIWQVGAPVMETACQADSQRFGVFSLGIERPVHDEDDLVEQLGVWLPELRRRHDQWRASFASELLIDP